MLAVLGAIPVRSVLERGLERLKGVRGEGAQRWEQPQQGGCGLYVGELGGVAGQLSRGKRCARQLAQ